jgi:hypothetical protein
MEVEILNGKSEIRHIRPSRQIVQEQSGLDFP